MTYILKNKNSYFILIFMICLLNFNLVGQSDYENHKKYWYYKARLNNDFIKVGNDIFPNDHGESQPFNERGFEDNALNYQFNSAKMKTADGGARQGIYISVLATEYRLLKNNGQDVSKIKHELFCALNAVNRLDYYAENIFSNGGMNPNLNGFFIRDDMPKDFVTNNYKHFNYYNNGVPGIDPNASPSSDRGFTQTWNKGQITVLSDFDDYVNSVNNGDSRDDQLKSKEESQDQAYYLLMGLALTSKLVDVGEKDGSNVFGYGSGESELQKESVNIADRIINHMKGAGGALGLWNIRNPANGNAFVQIGYDAKPYSYAIDNAGCFIKYGQDLPFVYNPQIVSPFTNSPFNSCLDYRNTYSTVFGPANWQLLVQANGGPLVDGQGFFNALAGVCNCIYEDLLFTNLNVLQTITAIGNQLNTLATQYLNSVQVFLNSLPPWVNHSATWVVNALNVIFTTFSTIQAAAIAAYNQQLTNLFPSFKTNTTDRKLVDNAHFNNVIYDVCEFPQTHNNAGAHLGSDMLFGIYLRDILHPNTSIIQLPSWLQFTVPLPTAGHTTVKNDMLNILNSAPCEGNFRKYPNVPFPYWGASNRIDRMDPLWRNCGSGSQGEYAGTDYMLLHNLYYLREGTTVPISDYDDRKVNANMPFNDGTFSHANKKTIGAFEYLTASNTIASNGAVDYKAGKEIALLPNFSAAQGSDFHAYISPFSCSGINDQMSRTNNSETDDDIYEATTSYISKPTKQETVVATSGPQSNEVNSLDFGMNNFNSQLDSLMRNMEIKYDLSNKIEVYPNPNSGEFNIEFYLTNSDNMEVSIYDFLGNEILKQKHITGYLNMPINLSDRAKGVYVIRFKNSGGEQFYKKVTIQ